MFRLMEAFFDIAYLGLIVSLGLRLLLEERKSAKLFGFTALLLGLGDAFHLIPRVISQLSPGGFEAHTALLSWGEFITSITMSVFYLLFYFYYRNLSKDYDKRKDYSVYALVLIRILLVLLPQNAWGTQGSYLFGLIRNIPFALLGLLLIIWTGRRRRVEGLKYTSPLIAASFLFYLPVVIGSRFFPLLGILMIPKTIAYVLLVAVGYRYFIGGSSPLDLLKLSITFLFMVLAGGVFFREFTKIYGWNEKSRLAFIHPHLLVLGFLFFLLLYFILREKEENLLFFQKPLLLYVTGLTWTVSALMVQGIYEILSRKGGLFPDAALSGMAGIGHILLGTGLILVMLQILRREARA